jgi:hypothetical protein
LGGKRWGNFCEQKVPPAPLKKLLVVNFFVKIFLIIFFSLLVVGTAAYFLWRKHSKANLDAEIDRIKIPDDTFDTK